MSVLVGAQVWSMHSHSPLDFFRLGDHPWIVNRRRLQVSYNLLCLVDAAMGDEPSRRFGKPWYCCEKYNNKEKLESKWKSPGNIVSRNSH